jgi:hypothetical protein
MNDQKDPNQHVYATPPKVYAAINAVQAALSKHGITKDRRNQQGSGYNFRGIDDVYNVLSGILAENKLVILPRTTERIQEERQSKSGGSLFYTTVKMEFDLVSAVDGSKHTVATYGEAMDSGDKSTNKAMSAAYKYAAFQAFCIPTEGDNDADGSTPEPTAKNAPKAKETAPLGPTVEALATHEQIKLLQGFYADPELCDKIDTAMDFYKLTADDFTKLNQKQAHTILTKAAAAKQQKP